MAQAVLALCPATAGAQLERNGTDWLQLAGGISPTFAEYAELEVVDGHAYFINYRGLHIFDVTDPRDLRFAAFYPGHFTSDLEVRDGLAYLTRYHDGLLILDVSDPRRPRRLSEIAHRDSTAMTAVTLLEREAVVTGGTGGGLYVIDISRPGTPTFLPDLSSELGGEISSVKDLKVVGDKIIASGRNDDYGTVEVFRRNELGTYEFAGGYDISSEGYATNDFSGLEVRDNLAVVGDRSNGYTVFDLSDPSEVERVFHSKESASDLVVEGNRAYVVGDRELRILDVTNPLQPVRLGTAGLKDAAAQVAVSGTMAYVVSHRDGLVAIDLSAVERPQILGQYRLATGGGADLELGPGTIAYAGGGEGLSILDISNPWAIRTLGQLPGAELGFVNRIRVAEGLAAVRYTRFSSSNLRIVDVSDPENPREVANIAQGRYDSHDLKGRLLAVARKEDERTVRFFDLSTPSKPVEVGSWKGEVFGHGIEVQLEGSLAFVLKNNRHIPGPDVSILDVSDPRSPQEVGKIDLGPDRSLAALHMVGSRLYAAASDGFLIFDLSNPAEPRIVGQHVDHRGYWSIAVHQGLLYADPDNRGSLRVFDILDESDPIFLGQTVNKVGRARRIQFAKDRIYLVDDISGLEIRDAARPTPKLQFLPRNAEPTVLDVVISGPAKMRHRIDGSRDLVKWTDLGLFQPSASGPAFFPVRIDELGALRFFRSRR